MKDRVTGNHRFAALAVALLLAAGVAACGGSSGGSSSGNGIAAKSPDAIAAAATKAAEAAKSVEVAGSLTQDGTTVALDLKMVAGSGATGWLTEQGKRFNMVLAGKTLYINAGKPFWTAFANAAAAKLLEGKWLKTPATGSYASVAKLGNLQTFFKQVFGHHGTLAKTATKTVNGVKVVGLRDAKQGGVLYIATTGKPYPIELHGDTGGSGGGKLTFSGYGTAFKIAPPSNAISLTQLEKAG
jgi:hypothetical protein